jgi:chromosome segregation ATPase
MASFVASQEGDCDAAVKNAVTASEKARQDAVTELEQASNVLRSSQSTIRDLEAQVETFKASGGDLAAAHHRVGELATQVEKLSAEKTQLQQEATEFKIGMQKEREGSIRFQQLAQEHERSVATFKQEAKAAKVKVLELEGLLNEAKSQIAELEKQSLFGFISKEIKALIAKIKAALSKNGKSDQDL